MRKADRYLKEQIEFFRKAVNRKPEGFYYCNQDDLLLQEGKFYSSSSLNQEELRIVRQAIDNLGFSPEYKKCYYNAQLLMLHDHTQTIKYIEGKALRIIPAFHGWNEINGKLIDITYKDERGEMILGNIPVNLSYCGIEIPREDVRRRIFDDGWADSFIDDYSSGFPLLKKKFA